MGGRAQRLPPRRIADDHDGGLCFDAVVVVVVVVVVVGGVGVGVGVGVVVSGGFVQMLPPSPGDVSISTL